MGPIEDEYADIETEVSEAEFREAVEQKLAQMDELMDERSAAMLVAQELADSQAETVADIEAGMDEVQFVAKVVSVGEVRSFEREDTEGRVLNVDVADETGSVRLAFWDGRAVAASEELEKGDVLRVGGSPSNGYSGVEVSVSDAEPADVEVDVSPGEGSTVDALRMGQSDVALTGQVLDTGAVRTFDRDDGSEGRVANITLGDETGRIQVTLWDERAPRAEELSPGATVEIVDGYVRERDGDIELHVGDQGRVDEVDASVAYEPEATPIEAVELGENADIAGVVRSADPVRTFERDDGSEGQVRNVRLQDDSGDIRVALWGEKADRDIAPGENCSSQTPRYRTAGRTTSRPPPGGARHWPCWRMRVSTRRRPARLTRGETPASRPRSGTPVRTQSRTAAQPDSTRLPTAHPRRRPRQEQPRLIPVVIVSSSPARSSRLVSRLCWTTARRRCLSRRRPPSDSARR